MAPGFVSSEDQSRFTEESYKQAAPGMPPPAAYISLAEKAINKKYDVALEKDFHNPVVTRRFYRNAPKEDQDIICVSYVYKHLLGGGFRIKGNSVTTGSKEPMPVLQALIRKDRSKVYLNVIEYKVD